MFAEDCSATHHIILKGLRRADHNHTRIRPEVTTQLLQAQLPVLHYGLSYKDVN